MSGYTTVRKRVLLLMLLGLFSARLIAQPVITSLSKNSALPGSTLTITGSGFNTTAANNVVFFGPVKATVNTASSTALNVTVPLGASFGSVSATNLATGRTGYSSKRFLPSTTTTGTATIPQWSGPIQIGGGYTALDAFVYDLDGDGKNEIITETYDKLVFQKNNSSVSTLSFDSVEFAKDFGHSFLISDMDGDGKPDIVTYGGYSIAFYKNISTPGTLTASSFAAGGHIAMSPGAGAAIADIDMDGRPDIITASPSAGLVVRRNISSAGVLDSTSFAAAETFSYPGINGICMGDMDGDGKPDIVTLNSSSKFTIIRNTSTAGSVSFAPRVDLSFAGPSYYGLTLVDVDSSGTLDIAASSPDGYKITVVDNQSAPGVITSSTFASHVDFYLGDYAQPERPLVHDVNNDGRPDLVTCSPGNWIVTRLTNRSKTTGTITNMTFTQLDSRLADFDWGLMGMGLGDMNNDGGEDVIFINPHTHDVVVYPDGYSGAYFEGWHMCVGYSEPVWGGTTFSSFDSSIVTISHDSIIAVSAGTTMLTYTCTGMGCGYNTIAVIVGPPVLGSITGTALMCVGSSSTLSNSITGGVWSSSNTGVATVGSASGVVTGVTNGTATITYTKSNSCGSASATLIVTVNASPDAGTISGAGSVLAGSSITLSGSVSGGLWTTSNSNASVSSTGVVTGVTAGAVTISYTVTNSCGTAVATKVVTVNEDAPTITGTLTVCDGATTALGTSIGSGTWSSGDASVASVSASGVVTGVSAGTADIIYTTATSSATVTVTVTAAPSITGTATLCPGTTTALTGSSTGGTWTGGSTVVATVGSTGVVTGIATGTTNITYSTGTGCNATITITVNPAPNSITGTFKACPGTTTTLSNMTAGGAWSSSDPGIALADAATGVITGVTAGIITVTYSAGAGCYRTASMTINPLPAAITGGLVICTGSTTALTDVTPGASWSSSNTAVASISSTGVVNGVDAGNATITYTAASTNCITTAIVTVNGVPAAIGGPATGCTGSDIALTNGVPGGTWSSSNAAVATVDPSSGVVTGVASGMTTITYTAGAGCYKTKAITINNSPTVTGYPMACIGRTTTLSGGSSGTWSSSTPSVATITTSGGYVSAVSTGTSTMTFTSSSTTCPATYIVTVIPVPSAITGATIGCQGSTVTLSNSTPGGSWTSSNTAIASVSSATGIVTAVGAGGTATISYSIGNNCRVTAPFSPKPLPAIIGGSTSVCTPMTTTLTCTTGGGTWSSSDASVATVGSAISVGNGVVTGVAAGNADITYTISATGCARSAAITVNTGLNPGTITSSGGFTLHTVSAPTTVTLSSTGASGGTWTSSNPAVATINASTGVVTAASAGTTIITYAVTGTCTNITKKAITVTAGRSAHSVESTVGNVQLYPNPTTGAFTFVSEEAGILNVFGIDGREITSYTITAGINSLNLPHELASGIYMCRYTSENGITTIVRLVYER